VARGDPTSPDQQENKRQTTGYVGQAARPPSSGARIGSYPAKFAALEMARFANSVIGPAKIADTSDGNEPKEN
jgi:hypothetical protein